MAEDDLAKLIKIQDRLRKDHEDAVGQAKAGNSDDRRQVIRTYDEVEAFGRIVDIEEKRRSEATRPVKASTAGESDAR